jgi:PAS domain S-box-containing protein
MFTDITAQKEAQVPLRRLAELVETADDAIIVQSRDGKIVSWNQGAERLYGYTKDEIRSEPTLRLFAPDSVPEYAGAVHTLRTGKGNEPCEVAQIHKDGHRFKASMRISPIGEKGEQLEGISIIVRGLPGDINTPTRAVNSDGQLKPGP